VKLFQDKEIMSIMTLIAASMGNSNWENPVQKCARNSLRRLSGLSPAEIQFYKVE
jgi:hypothetical protein